MKKLLFLCLLLCFSAQAQAQDLLASKAIKPCVENFNSPGQIPWRWPDNTKVSVYTLLNAFTLTETAAIRRAVDNWNAILAEGDIGIKMTFAEETGQVLYCKGCITLNRGQTFQNQRHLAEIYPNLEGPDRLMSALITVDIQVTDLEVLTSVVTHELAHSLGLNDCPKCSRGATIMALYRGRNKGNDLLSPSPCDRATMADGYDKLRGPGR
jgi:hypothetical protein